MKTILSTSRTVGTLLLLGLLLPLNLLVTAGGWLVSRLAKPRRRPLSPGRCVLLTGGKMSKALQLARAFKNDGHRVVLIETEKYWLTGHRFSNAVDRFCTVPCPESDFAAYRDGLLDIVRKERVDIMIPVASPASALHDSRAKPALAPYCEVFHFDLKTTRILDDKFAFCEKAAALGLPAPRVHRITDPEQVIGFDFASDGREYVLKSIRYDSVHRLNLKRLPCDDLEDFVRGLPISPSRPWVMQEFIRGQEYCTHSTVRDGRIQLFGCSRSSAFQINYEHVAHEKIHRWVESFVGAMHLSGQISFDFIETEDGEVYPIECNPRTHTAITMFHDHPDLASSYLEVRREEATPLVGSPPTYWLYHELWRLTRVRSFAQLADWWRQMRRGTDAIYRAEDPLPFLMVHHWQVPLLLLGSLANFRDWVRIDFNIGKLVEHGGD